MLLQKNRYSCAAFAALAYIVIEISDASSTAACVYRKIESLTVCFYRKVESHVEIFYRQL